MDPLFISFLVVFSTLACSESAPVSVNNQPVVDLLTAEDCDFVIAGAVDQAVVATEKLFYRGEKVDKTTVCRFNFESITAKESEWSNFLQVFTNDEHNTNGDVSVECKLNSGEIIRSCLLLQNTDKAVVKALPSVKLSRRLLSADNDDWKDTDRDRVTRGTVIGGIGGVIVLIVVVALCARKSKKEEPVKGVRISRISSFQVGVSVSMQDVQDALDKCDSSTETGSHDNANNRNSSGLDRNSLHVDGQVGNNVGNQARPSSQVSTGSASSTQGKSRLVNTNSKTLDRRLPEPPPNTPPPQDDDNDGDLYDKIPEKDPNYDKVKDETDPNYSKVKDPDYERIKKEASNGDDEKDPNYERVNVDGDEAAQASGRESTKGDDLYAEVKGENSNSKVKLEDMYTKVAKDGKAKDSATSRLSTMSTTSTTSDDPYATVKGEDGAAPPVPVKIPGLQLDGSPGPSPRQQRTASQGSTTSAGPPVSPIDRPLPQHPTSSQDRKEPSYSEVSVRESIGSIKEREAKAKQGMTLTYETVDESDVYYSTVKTTESSPLPPTSSPPPLPSASTRPTSTVSSREGGLTLAVGAGNRSSITSDLYASIGDTDDSPGEMPVYAQVNKTKRSSATSQDGQGAGAEETNAMYSKVNKSRTSQSSEPGDAGDPQSQRSSKRSSNSNGYGNDPGYARIKDLDEDTEPGYQAIADVKGEDNSGEVMQSSDMVHISGHKVDENFWKKKDHTYQSIKDNEKDDDDEKDN